MGEKYLKTKDGSIEDVVKQMQNKVLESDYQDKFKKELDNAGKPLGHMTGMEKKEFYSKVEEACWDGYKKVGMKEKDGKQVPNCVPDKDNKIPKEKKEEKEMNERDGANTSSRKGSVWKKAKKWRFGMKVGEHDPSKDKEVKEGFFNTKTFAQMAEDIKSKKKSPEKTAKVEPTSSKDSKETPKDADQLEKQLVIAQGQINLLKQKIENEKNKIVKPEPNKETGEVPLTIGVAHKLLKDKEEKEKKEVKEARYMVSGTMGYKGIGGVDGFEMVINANSEQDAIRRAEKELDRARSRRSIGPGGGGNLEDVDIEGAERTTEPLQKPYSYMLNHNDPSIKESHMSTAKKQNAKQRAVGGEKEIVKSPKTEWKTFAMMAKEIREGKGPKNAPDGESNKKKEQDAGTDTRDPKKKTMSGQVATSPEMNPKVDYKY